MSSAKDETMSSNESWKKAGGKNKYGKPTGTREIVEKYKAVGLDDLDCNNYKQYGIRARVAGYECDRAPARIAHLLDKETHKGNKAALKCEALSEEDEASLEQVEHAAREEARQLARDDAETNFDEAGTTKDEAKVADVKADENAHALILVPLSHVEDLEDGNSTARGELNSSPFKLPMDCVAELST